MLIKTKINEFLDTKELSNFLKKTIFVFLVSIIVGSISAWFLHGLDFVTKIRENHNFLIYLLPLAGCLSVLMYSKFSKKANQGNHLILDNYQNEEIKIPFLMMPLVFVGSLITHLFGGSAGREGTAVQMGTVVSDFINKKLLKNEHFSQKFVLKIGVASGFASVFGTPWSALFFAFEWFKEKKINGFYLILIILAAWLSHWVCLLWNVKHLSFNYFSSYNFKINDILYLILYSFALFLLVFLVEKLLKFSIIFFKNTFQNEYQRIIVSGIIVMLYFFIFKNTCYLGLGVNQIQESFIKTSNFQDFLNKTWLTVVTISGGFKGGEVTPLFFIGSNFGSYLSQFIPLSISVLAALGFVTLFSGIFKVPFTGIVLAFELFGLFLLPEILITTLFVFSLIYFTKNLKINYRN